MAIAEIYRNALYGPNHPCYRFWVAPDVLVGGCICDGAEWGHLRNDFGIGAVLNVETEHDDAGKGIEHLQQCCVPDDGSAFPAEYVRTAVSFARVNLSAGRKLYVHCQMGGSRSPAFAYAVLRWHHGMSAQRALETVKESKGNMLWGYGDHPYHKSYLDSVERALRV